MSDATVRLVVLGDSTGAQRSLSSFDRTLGSVGRTAKIAATALGATFAGALVYSIKKAADFETTLATFQATAKATGKEMEAVSRLAKRLGNDVKLPGASAADAAEAMTELAKGGLSVRDSMKAARATLLLATAAQVSHARAAEIVADSLNAFRLSGDKAVKVADLLANAANASTASIDDMALAFQQSSAVLVGAGQTIEDATAALTILANAGIKGSDAGTALRNAISFLQSPTATASKAIQKLGLDLFDAQGNMLPLPKLIAEIASKTEGMTQKQRANVLTTIAGRDSIKALNALLDVSPKKWAAITKAVEEAGGAQRLAGARMRGFNGALEAFKSTVETVAINLGTKLLPHATTLLRTLSDLAGSASLGDLGEKLRTIFEGEVKPWTPEVDWTYFRTEVKKGPKGHDVRVRVPVEPDIETGPGQGFETVWKRKFGRKVRMLVPLEADWSRTDRPSSSTKGLKGWIEDAWGKVNWSAVWGKAFDVAGDFGKKMLEAGKNIVKGALEGDWEKVGQAAALAIVGGLAAKKVGEKLGITGALSMLLRGGAKIGGGVFGGRTGVVPVFVTNPGFGGGGDAPGGGKGGGWLATVGKVLGVLALAGAAAKDDRLFGIPGTGDGPSVREMWAWWGRPGATRAAATPQSSLPPSRISGAAAGPFLALANSTQDFEAAAKRAEKTGRGSFQRVADAAGVAAAAIAAMKPKTVNVRARTIPKDVKELDDAIGIVSGMTVAVRAAVDLGPLQAFARMLANLPTSKRITLQTVASGPGRAGGGAIPGSPYAGDVVPAMLTGGEVVLNAQQQRLLGPDRIRRVLEHTGAPMDGFAFAKGKRARGVAGSVGAARKVLAAVVEIDQREANLDRAYGQMSRDFARSQETYLVTDADGNESRDEAAISKRVGEIDQLISSREEMLALIDDEKAELEKAIRRLDAAVKELLAAIAAARAHAEEERGLAAELAKRIARERKKKNPDEKKIGRWEKDRQRHLTYADRHMDRVRTLSGTLSEMRGGRATAESDLTNVVPFDRRDVELDILDLRQERSDVLSAKPGSSSSSSSSSENADRISALGAEVGRLRLALGIQGAQIPLIGSFAKGALYVPGTGLAMVHAGERIVPVNERSDVGGSSGGSTVVRLEFASGMEWLAQFVDARVEGTGADRVAVQIGQNADVLRREGRL